MRISFVGDESLERNIFELRADKMFRFPDFNMEKECVVFLEDKIIILIFSRGGRRDTSFQSFEQSKLGRKISCRRFLLANL